MERPAGYSYIFAQCVLGLAFSLLFSYFSVMARGWIFLAVFLADGGYFLLTMLMMIRGRGYLLASAAPFAALPLWGAPVCAIAVIIDLAAHGMEGSHTDLPGEFAGYIGIASLVLLPFWLGFYIPYWRILSRPDVKQVLGRAITGSP